MYVRFKFRSSASFDSVEIEGGRPSISVRELKSKIIRYKHLDVSHDFDLLLSDAVSGQEFSDEGYQILSGASVIIKRVPAGSPRLVGACVGSQGNAGIKGESMVKSCLPSLVVQNVEIGNFDDFGDYLPTIEAARSSCGVNDDQKLNIMHEKINDEVPSVANCNLEASQNAHIPSELKCSLCDDIFREPVMIPCCQQSFCIYVELTKKHKCPKCLSTTPAVEDFLPNVSLRQAIDRFLKCPVVIEGSEHALDQYAPDGESGIQISCAMSCHQRQSPSATSGGSNQINADRSSGTLASSSYYHGETDGKKHGMVNSVRTEELGTDFQGENQFMKGEEGSEFTMKQALWVNMTGAEKRFVERGWYKKGARTCYVCGSPDHLVRDCPATLRPHPMFPMGAMPAYSSTGWSGSPYSQINPFGSPYFNPRITPFHAAMVPAVAFTGPTYMPPMFGTMPAYRAFSRIGGTPVGSVLGAEWHQDHLRYMEHQGCDKRQNLSRDNFRLHSSDNEEDNGLNVRMHYGNAERGNSQNYDKGREDGASYSNDSSDRRPYQKHLHHNYWEDETEKSGSEVEDMPRSFKWHGEKQHKSDHKNGERHSCQEEHIDSDSCCTPSWIKREEEIKRRGSESDIKRDKQKHCNHSDVVMEPRYGAKESSRGF